MKYIGYELEKTCFFDTELKKGVILHEHIADVRKELIETGDYIPKSVFVDNRNNRVSMKDNQGMSKVVDNLLSDYINNYMVCPKCQSVRTTNPIVVDKEQQNKIINNDRDLTEEEQKQLIERLDDFTYFTVHCRDCSHSERIDNANTSDDGFIREVLKSRQQNLTKRLTGNESDGSSQLEESQPSNTNEYYPPQRMYVDPNAVNYPVEGGFYYYPVYMPPYYPPYPTAGYGTPYAFIPPYYPPYNYVDVAVQNNQEMSLAPSSQYAASQMSQSNTPQSSGSSPNGGKNSNNGGNSNAKLEAESSYKSAGVLPYAIHNGKLFFLLGKEHRGGKGVVLDQNKIDASMSKSKIAKHLETWSEFGGKREKEDQSSLHTAAREFFEETKGAFGDITEFLSNARSFYNQSGKYVLYLCQLPYKTIEQIKQDCLKELEENISSTEKKEFGWVDGEELAKRVFSKHLGTTENFIHPASQLIQIKVNGLDNVELLHPFALTLLRTAKSEILKLVEKK